MTDDQIIEMAKQTDMKREFIDVSLIDGSLVAFARLVEAATKEDKFQNACDAVIRKNAERYMFLRCMSVHDYKELVMENLYGGATFDELIDEHIAAAIRNGGAA